MKIKIFTTGGTIDKIYFDAKSDYQVGQSSIPDILDKFQVVFDYEVESIMKKDSLEMTDEDREIIFRKVESCGFDRCIITHGTDTMIQTALKLKALVNKTIVLTGSLLPALFRESDAVFNIGCASAAVQTLPAGVYIVMNGSVFDPSSVRKNISLNRFEHFHPAAPVI